MADPEIYCIPIGQKAATRIVEEEGDPFFVIEFRADEEDSSYVGYGIGTHDKDAWERLKAEHHFVGNPASVYEQDGEIVKISK